MADILDFPGQKRDPSAYEQSREIMEVLDLESERALYGYSLRVLRNIMRAVNAGQTVMFRDEDGNLTPMEFPLKDEAEPLDVPPKPDTDQRFVFRPPFVWGVLTGAVGLFTLYLILTHILSNAFVMD